MKILIDKITSYCGMKDSEIYPVVEEIFVSRGVATCNISVPGKGRFEGRNFTVCGYVTCVDDEGYPL